MKKGDIIITFRENVGTIAYNVSNGRWCVYFPNEESFEGQSDVNESVMYTVLTKEEIEELAKDYLKKHEGGYEFVNFHIGENDVEDAFKTGIIKGIKLGYEMAKELEKKGKNGIYEKNEK